MVKFYFKVVENKARLTADESFRETLTVDKVISCFLSGEHELGCMVFSFLMSINLN